MSSAESQPNSGPGYARYPEHKVEVEPSPHRMRVELEGETVADSANTLVLHESGHDPVYYFPRADVVMELLEPTAHSTECPFKGTASYWTLRAGGSRADNAVWSYEQPYDEVAEIKDRLAFYPDRVGAIYRDGEKMS